MTAKAIETDYNPDGSIEFSLSGCAYRCRLRRRATELEVIDGAELVERIDLAPGRTFVYISEDDAAQAAHAYLQRLGKYDLPATNRTGGRRLRAELGQTGDGESIVRFFTIKIGGGRGGKLGELSLSQLEQEPEGFHLRDHWRLRDDDVALLREFVEHTLTERALPVGAGQPESLEVVDARRRRRSSLAGRSGDEIVGAATAPDATQSMGPALSDIEEPVHPGDNLSDDSPVLSI